MPSSSHLRFCKVGIVGLSSDRFYHHCLQEIVMLLNSFIASSASLLINPNNLVLLTKEHVTDSSTRTVPQLLMELRRCIYLVILVLILLLLLFSFIEIAQ